MKTSIKKLRGFGLQKHNKQQQRSRPHLDELSLASQDMLDMKDCYESLLSSAAATANSAFEFSESLREMGDCLLEKTAMNDEEDSAKVLLMLGKLQFELQRSVDKYRAHIFQTISAPSESLLNELYIVEEMKRQCDEKRDEYEKMTVKHKERGWLRSSKGDSSSEHLKVAREEYEEAATLFIFRMKSLKRGCSQSLLTQAARHYAAQLCFFRKGLKSLEAIEPHVTSVTSHHHIDYHFAGLEDDADSNDEGDDDNDETDSSDDFTVDDDDDYDDDELSLADIQSDQGQGAFMELDKVEKISFPKVDIVNSGKENIYSKKGGGNAYGFFREEKWPHKALESKSAPLYAVKNTNNDPHAQRVQQTLQRYPSSSRKLQTYVLPTPTSVVDRKTTAPTTATSSYYSGSIITKVSQQKKTTQNLWHSSPLELRKKTDDNIRNSGPILTPVLKRSSYHHSNNNTSSTSSRLPPTEGLLSPQHGVSSFANKKIKRPPAFSGPLTEKSWSNNNSNILFYSSGPLLSTQQQNFSGSLSRNPPQMPSSFKNFSTSIGGAAASSTFTSSPKISELHELPRPPPNSMHHSAPLVPNGEKIMLSRSKNKVGVSKPSNIVASTKLPLPPQIVARSYSIPSRGQILPPLHPPPLVSIVTISTA